MTFWLNFVYSVVNKKPTQIHFFLKSSESSAAIVSLIFLQLITVSNGVCFVNPGSYLSGSCFFSAQFFANQKLVDMEIESLNNHKMIFNSKQFNCGCIFSVLPCLNNV